MYICRNSAEKVSAICSGLGVGMLCVGAGAVGVKDVCGECVGYMRTYVGSYIMSTQVYCSIYRYIYCRYIHHLLCPFWGVQALRMHVLYCPMSR